MLRVIVAAAALWSSSVVSAAVLQQRQQLPSIPSIDQCETQCTPAGNGFQCDENASEDCYCTSSNLQSLADCYTCLTPYMQSQDLTWDSDIQATLSDIVMGCALTGNTVAAPTFDGAVVPTSTVDDSGDFPTDTASGSTPTTTSGASETAPSPEPTTANTEGGSTSGPAGQSSTSGSSAPSPTTSSKNSPGNVNGVLPIASASVTTLIGIVAGVITVLGF